MTPGRGEETEKCENVTFKEARRIKVNTAPLQAGPSGEMCTTSLTSLLLPPVLVHGRTTPVTTFGDVSSVTTAFHCCLQFLQLLQQQHRSVPCRKHLCFWYLRTRGARGRLGRVQVPLSLRGNGRSETSIQADSPFPRHAPSCLGHSTSRRTSPTRFPLPAAQISEILPP